jgi:rhamnose transport system ATP-binding protein
VSGLEFLDLHKSFGAVRALRGVSFDVAEGETHGCVGENGAGKSTLLKILAGLVHADRGEIRWHGERLHIASPRHALAAGIEIVYQERLCFPNLSVAANIFAGREITRSGGKLDHDAMHARAADTLRRLQIRIPSDRRMESLSSAHVQLVQVARALAFDCRVLVLDEPTTSLTHAESEHLFEVLDALKTQRVTVLFVSHRMPEVFRLCDRITVLRDGQYVGTYARASATPDQIVRAMVGREPPQRVEQNVVQTPTPPALTVRGLSRPPRVRNISFDVRAAEIVALFGLVGSGRSELLETLFGLERPAAGHVEVNGRAIAAGSAHAAMRAGVAFVPEDRQRQGLFFNLSLRDNIALPASLLTARHRIARDAERSDVAGHTAALAIKASSLDATPDRLSGGNQQKVVLAKWLSIAPRVLLLDEPTKGVDVGAKFELHNIIRREAARGMACLMASSDLHEVLAIAHRILVLRDGRLAGELPAATATEEQVLQLATAGVEAPA